MIPLFAHVEIEQRYSHFLRRLNFCFPLFLVWLALLPFALVLSPLVLLACLITWINPIRLALILWEILSSSRGTEIEIDQADFMISITIPKEFL